MRIPMPSFCFQKLRRLFVEKDLPALSIYTEELIRFILSTSYLEGKAYYHPLGFLYSKLYQFENTESIRLHIWHKKYYRQKPLMDIHNHYYVVNSYIYKGCINNNIFNVDEDNGYKYAIYEGAYNKNEDRVLRRSQSEIALSLNRTERHCQKTLYQISTNTIHSGYPVDDHPVCTIVYTEKPGIPSPLVVGPIDGEFEYYFPTKIVETHVLTNVLNDIISAK